MILRLLPLLSRPSRQGLGALVLPAVAFMSVTALLAIVLGGAQTFWGYTDELGGFYQACAAIALALLVAPLLSLGAAAARLSARRRDDRLAALRLLGATGRGTAALAVTEAAGVALGGALLGVAVAYAAAPLVGLVRFRGEPIGTAGAALPPWVSALLVAVVVVIATVSAVLSLRRVIISPLGVATRQSAPKTPWLQAGAAIVVLLVALFVVSNLAGFGQLFGMLGLLLAFGASFGIALLAIDLIGAWMLAVFGRAKARRAKTPAELIAARLVLESPRAAWRQVSGVAMSSFMALVAGSGLAVIGAAEDQGGFEGAERFLVGDIRTGVMLTVLGTFVMVACSVGVSQAAQILDRRDVARSLDIMGTPFEVQDAARRKATVLPLLLAAVGSAVVAGILLFPLLGAAMIIAPISLGVTLSSILFGIGLVLVALVATRPLLRRTAAA